MSPKTQPTQVTQRRSEARDPAVSCPDGLRSGDSPVQLLPCSSEVVPRKWRGCWAGSPLLHRGPRLPSAEGAIASFSNRAGVEDVSKLFRTNSPRTRMSVWGHFLFLVMKEHRSVSSSSRYGRGGENVQRAPSPPRDKTLSVWDCLPQLVLSACRSSNHAFVTAKLGS